MQRSDQTFNIGEGDRQRSKNTGERGGYGGRKEKINYHQDFVKGKTKLKKRKIIIRKKD